MKKGIIGFILGIMICGVVVYATGKLPSDSVSYNNTTVKDSLDNLFSDVENGKTKIAEAITNKGVETSSTASYDKMVSNINSISTGNPYLRFNTDTGYIQVCDVNDDWIDIYYASELPLQNKLLLYDSGNQYEKTTGGWRNYPKGFESGYPTTAATFASSYIQCAASGNSCFVYQNNKIDLSNYTKLKLEFTQVISQANSPYIVIKDNDSSLAPNNGVATASASAGTGTYTMDISSINGEYYIVIGVNGGLNRNVKIQKVWLEK